MYYIHKLWLVEDQAQMPWVWGFAHDEWKRQAKYYPYNTIKLINEL